jgi:hypothetical protein
MSLLLFLRIYTNQEWWHMPVILVLRRLRQKELEFKASLGYRARLCLKTTKIHHLSSLPSLQNYSLDTCHVAVF